MISKTEQVKKICTEVECERAIYEPSTSKCVLHCTKRHFAQANSPDSQQYEFNKELVDFIIELIWDPFDSPVSESLSFEKDEVKAEFDLGYAKCCSIEEKKNYLKKYIFESDSAQVKINYIGFDGIHFPKVTGGSSGHYSFVLSRIEKISFENCVFYGDKVCVFLSGFVGFDQCTFEGNWDIRNDKLYDQFVSDPIYCGCHFKKKIKNGSSTESLSKIQFDEFCTFEDGIEFNNLTIEANVFSRDSLPQYCLDMSKFGKMNGLFEFIDCTFSSDQEIYLANASTAEFSLKRCTFEKKFKIRNLEYSEGYEYQQENKAALKSLIFNSCSVANNEYSYLRIGFLKECTFSLKNLKNQQSSELNIGDCHFTSFELTNFRNLGKFKLFKINILKCEAESKNDLFKIDNTSIGNTDFQSIDFTSFSKVFMFDNIFSEIDYTNVKWPETIHVSQFQKGDDGEVEKKRDTYRTLKNVALKNNDRPQALSFYAKEMESHYQIIKWIPGFGDKFSLWFNQSTNGFGMNWKLPLILLSYFSVLFYGFLLISIDGTLTAEHYWAFLNPMHKTEFIGEGNWTGWTYFIDVLFRVIQALLLYQTIQAFRKFSRPL